MGQKKLIRKAEPPSKRGIAWPRWTGFRGMTLREWLPIVGALLIPVVIAAGTWGITWQQSKIEDQRAQAERKLAEDRAQDEALQAYLDQMSGLLLEDDLRTSDEGSEVRTLAQERTLTVLGTLDDPSRKDAVIQFLGEAGLIQGKDKRAPTIPLRGADLRGIDLWNNRTDLRGADLYEADLRGADLFSANLSGADLGYALLSDVDALSGANLSGADLQGIRKVTKGPNPINWIELYNAEIAAQTGDLKGATMTNGQKYEEWLKDREKRQQDE